MVEQLANFGETTLAEALDDSETDVDVTDGSVFPASGNFRVLVGDEIMLVTARSTNTLTVTRGAESTTAAAHDSGADIRAVLTAASLPAIIAENDGVIVAATSPGAPTASDAIWVDTSATPLVAGSFDPDEHMPRHILILPQVQAPSATPQGTWVRVAFNEGSQTYPLLVPDGSVGHYMLYNSSEAVNDEVTWNVPLSAGTWAIRLMGRKSTNTGIITCEIDGSSVGTVDTYAGSVVGFDSSITGVTVATTGLKALGLVAATKHASSSSYMIQIGAISLTRTA